MAPEPEQIYDTAADIAKIVRLSNKSIYRLVEKEPTFPSVRILGSIRFPRERVIRWLRAREQGRK